MVDTPGGQEPSPQHWYRRIPHAESHDSLAPVSWQHFKNIESIRDLKHVSHLTPEPDFTPVWGDDEIGELPEDFSDFSYPNLSFVGNEAFLSYGTAKYKIGLDQEGNRTVKVVTGSRMRILPVEWFYT